MRHKRNILDIIRWSSCSNCFTYDEHAPGATCLTKLSGAFLKKCLHRVSNFSTYFCFFSHLESNNRKWIRPFLFFHSWPYHLTYLKHFTKIKSVINYFYLQSLPLQKKSSRFLTSEIKIILNGIYFGKMFVYFK